MSFKIPDRLYCIGARVRAFYNVSPYTSPDLLLNYGKRKMFRYVYSTKGREVLEVTN